MTRVAKFPSRSKSTRRARPKLVSQFLIILSHTEPVVWRRIQVPESYNFWDLHVAIQDAMGWEDRHLHEFRLFDNRTGQMISIGLPAEMTSEDRPVIAGWTVSVSTVLGSREWHALPMVYAYDFGDDWEHIVIHEGVQQAIRSIRYPQCLSGERACPPEDCGGVHGYEQLITVLADADHPEHESRREWVGGKFDPDAFDKDRVVFDDPRERFNRAFAEDHGE